MLRRCLHVLIWLLLMTGSGIAAEGKDAPLSIFFELFGNGGVYSVNADYRIREDCSLRLGFVKWNISGFFGENGHLTAFPLMVNYLYGSGNHWLETGGGLLYGHYKETTDYGSTLKDYNFTTLTGSISYRYQRPQGGYFFKAGFTPMYPLGSKERQYPTDIYNVMPWMGVAWGFSI